MYSFQPLEEAIELFIANKAKEHIIKKYPTISLETRLAFDGRLNTNDITKEFEEIKLELREKIDAKLYAFLTKD